jgi:hypothetical protein
LAELVGNCCPKELLEIPLLLASVCAIDTTDERTKKTVSFSPTLKSANDTCKRQTCCRVMNIGRFKTIQVTVSWQPGVVRLPSYVMYEGDLGSKSTNDKPFKVTLSPRKPEFQFRQRNEIINKQGMISQKLKLKRQAFWKDNFNENAE